MANIEINAPRLINKHRLLMRSMRDISDTPIQAAKNVSPEVIIDGEDFVIAIFMALDKE